MREPERDRGRLLDILEAANNVIEFTEGLSLQELFADKIRFFAVEKNVEIIGEAAYMLTPAFKEQHPEILWHKIISMRHTLVHGYSTVIPKTLWDTALNDVPKLKKQIEKWVSPEDLALYGSR